jgi:hypothetical protein
MVAAARIGDGGVLGALVLLLDALDGRGFSLLPCCMLVMGLVFAAVVYMAYSGAPGWGRYAVAAVPGVVTAMLPLVMLGRGSGWRGPGRRIAGGRAASVRWPWFLVLGLGGQWLFRLGVVIAGRCLKPIAQTRRRHARVCGAWCWGRQSWRHPGRPGPLGLPGLLLPQR